MTPQAVLTALLDKRDLTRDEMLSLMRRIMGGELTPVQIAGILVALRAKGETVAEIAAAAEVMRELSTKVPVGAEANLVDTCGTGGDGAHTFNISTASALVAAAAGVKVAKHGGRSVSSTCGSADVLEALGVNVNLTPAQVAQSIHEIGVGFMFAPNHHSAMKYAAPVRRELGVRTLFNLLGPLTNPAGAKNQVMGVFRKDLCRPLAEVLKSLGANHVMVVHGGDGMDEITITTETHVAELKDGGISEYAIDPEEFGMKLGSIEKIKANNPEEAKARLVAVLDNTHGAARDIVAINAGAAIYVGGMAQTLEAGVKKAIQAIASGEAKAKLEQLIAFSNRIGS
ncbi:MAG: anthranilate phosphoribosyltransferase [Betaproteobacteria bacterium CG2_30_59_46]|nr:MAG: anthranilate phosphoribosyltransferase [Betaproteobacteria bacterium CG2_30_59_46]PIQ14229.1 MAG: anthranilate phosphoribosyltransferase [Hydrogenophilales bacterium CG18_big_fil_WC_8_21_14_2_50_58_12]PIY01003.1 MAG: anthranilate phosphoribosyltransferase [Hydrogenophilales bacterium CG_4_10_14_3_um_filter_58_23]PJB08941.1 MAG: anthranilate phosphoribosyltransferase [Hydrogenophilales bacterium CG_4_9_14_3_um_filter_59_35]